jgi:hypothetical protein
MKCTVQPHKKYDDLPEDVKVKMVQEDRYNPLFGGLSEAPTWDEYLEMWKEPFREKLAAIRICIEENNLIGKTGGEFCNDNMFEFEDGTIISFSWRAWGDLMQAIVGKREGYMAYYM